MGTHCSKLDDENSEQKKNSKTGTVRDEKPLEKIFSWQKIEGFEKLKEFLQSDELNEILRKGGSLRDVLLKLRFKNYREVNEISASLMMDLGFSKNKAPQSNNIFIENEKSNAYVHECQSMLVPDLIIFYGVDPTVIKNLSLPLEIIEYFTQLYQMDKYAKLQVAKDMSSEWWRNGETNVNSPFDFLYKKTERIKQLVRTEVHYHNPLLLSGVESKYLHIDNRTLEVTNTGGTLLSSFDNQVSSLGSNRPQHSATSPFRGIEKSQSKTRNSFTNYKPLIFSPSQEPIMTPERSNVMQFTFDEKNIGKHQVRNSLLSTPDRGQNAIIEEIEEYDVNEEEGPKDSNESGYIVKANSGKKTEKSEESVPLLRIKKKN